jgi:transcriptional regulator with XRE-family HTH domain
MDEFQIIYVNVGKKIKELRVKKGMSQQELAYQCNFEKSNISRIESGKTNVTLKTLYLISKALSISIKELVDIE